MRTSRRIASVLWALAALALVIAGPVMVYKGFDGQSQVRDQLAAQKIQFPAKGDKGLPVDLASYGGQKVTTGPQAKAYADMVEHHVLAATGGKTYAACARPPPSSRWVFVVTLATYLLVCPAPDPVAYEDPSIPLGPSSRPSTAAPRTTRPRPTQTPSPSVTIVPSAPEAPHSASASPSAPAPSVSPTVPSATPSPSADPSP